MARQTYQASLQFLVVFFIVQPVVLQAIGVMLLKKATIPSTVNPQEVRNTTISNSSGIPTGTGQETVNTTTLYNANASIPALGNTTNFPSLLSTFAQINHSSHTESSPPSEITAEITTKMTDFPTASFVTNSTHQNPGGDSEVTTLPSPTSSLFSNKTSHSVSASQLPVARPRMKDSEFILTVVFALILTLTILGLLVYVLNKYRMRRAQYSHHQLHDTSFDTVDIYATPDDTLVISGGLYDAPRTFSSSMTAYEDGELQTDHLPFSVQHGQFRLEFFCEKEKGISLTSETLQGPPGSL
ncbi:uncharacterized protein LOC143836130 isoform X1 [Paroedura picta]|uniref:uncharacterized protein LOC143836130 isoform X1 n=1 Tax=Paroedura picta TaxID=143630 RepID=UPI0040567667